MSADINAKGDGLTIVVKSQEEKDKIDKIGKEDSKQPEPPKEEENEEEKKEEDNKNVKGKQDDKNKSKAKIPSAKKKPTK